MQNDVYYQRDTIYGRIIIVVVIIADIDVICFDYGHEYYYYYNIYFVFISITEKPTIFGCTLNNNITSIELLYKKTSKYC